MANKTSCLYFLFVFAFMHSRFQQSYFGCPLGKQKSHSRCCRVNLTPAVQQFLSTNFLAIDTIWINQFLQFLGAYTNFFICLAYHGRQIYMVLLHQRFAALPDIYLCFAHISMSEELWIR